MIGRLPLAILFSLLIAPVALADAMSDRFRDDFGDPPPTTGSIGQAPPAAAPAVPLATQVTRHRPAKVAPHAPAARASAALPLATEPGFEAGTPRSPASKAIAAAGTIPPADGVDISWNALDRRWDGMFILNNGPKPLSVTAVYLNDRQDCQLKPYRLAKLKSALDLDEAIKAWGMRAVNLFGLSEADVSEVFVPTLPPELQHPGLDPDRALLKSGYRMAMFNGTGCDLVDKAQVTTDAGVLAVKLKQAYSGH
jgi:hypothetical protein